jgi:ABC-type glutathione transport system ATPase component
MSTDPNLISLIAQNIVIARNGKIMKVGEEEDMQVDQQKPVSQGNTPPSAEKPVNFGEPFLWGEEIDGFNLDPNSNYI